MADPKQVPLKGSDGSFYTVAPEDVADELKDGAEYAQPEEWQAAGEEARKAKAYGDRPIRAAVEGFGRGFLPGVTPYLQKLGGETSEEMSELEHRNALAAGVGEFGGLIGGQVLGEGVAGATGLGDLAKSAVTHSPFEFGKGLVGAGEKEALEEGGTLAKSVIGASKDKAKEAGLELAEGEKESAAGAEGAAGGGEPGTLAAGAPGGGEPGGTAGAASEIGAAPEAPGMDGPTAEATPLAGRLAKSAAINAGYGAGQVLNEAELSDNYDHLGQQLLAGATLGGLTGGVGEGLFALGERVAPSVVSAASDATDSLGKSAKDLFDHFHSWKTGKPLAEIQKLSSAAIEDGPEAFGAEALAKEKADAAMTSAANKQDYRTWTRDQKAAAKDAMAAQDASHASDVSMSSRDLANKLQAADDGNEDVLRRTNSEARPEQVQNLTFDHPADKAVSAVQDTIEKTKANLDTLGNKALYKKSPALGTARDLLDEVDKKISDLSNAGAPTGAIHDAWNDYKQGLGKLLMDKSATGAERDAINNLKVTAWADAKNLLESPAAFGKLGPATAAWNAGQSAMLDAKEDLMKSLGQTVKVKGAKTQRVSPTQVEAAIKGADSTKAQLIQEKIDRYIAASKSMHAEASKVYQGTSATAPDPDELRALLDRVTEARTKASDVVSHEPEPVAPAFAGQPPERVKPSGPATTFQQIGGGKFSESMEGARETGGIGLGVLAHHVLGPVGGILSLPSVYQAATNTARHMETLARVASVAKRVSSAIQTGAAAFVRSGAGSVARGTIERAATMQALSGGSRDNKRGLGDFERRSNEIDNLATNQQLLMNTLGRNTSRLSEAAPHATLAANTAAARSIAYLQQIKPKNPNTPGLVQPDEKWEPPESVVAQYAEVHNVVAKPLTALDHLRGGTLTPAMVTALQQTVPELHAQMCDELQRQLLDHPKSAAKMNYEKRLQLSMFLGKPIDQSTSPAYAQAVSAPPPQPAPQPGQKRVRQSQSGLKNLNFAQAAATGIEARQTGAREA